MTDYQSLPSSVLAKIAQLDARCLTLNAALDPARSELDRLRQQLSQLSPRMVMDEYGANREAERIAAEKQRLTAAVDAQADRCEQLERRVRAEERIVRDCKTFLHELPDHARLTVIEGHPGKLDDIRQRIQQLRDEINRLQLQPVPSDDIADRIARYVNTLAARAQPIIQGIGDGQTLRVLYPLNESANRNNLTNFVQHEGNPLLLLSLVQPERLTERLLQTVTHCSISQTERDQRLHTLQQQLTQLRYDEEASICTAITRGDDVWRGSPPAWAVLMVQMVPPSGDANQVAA